MYPRLELELYEKIGHRILRLPMVQVGNGKSRSSRPTVDKAISFVGMISL